MEKEANQLMCGSTVLLETVIVLDRPADCPATGRHFVVQEA